MTLPEVGDRAKIWRVADLFSMELTPARELGDRRAPRQRTGPDHDAREIAQHFHRILNPTLHNRLFIVKSKATPEAVFAALKKLSRSGGFALVIVDTLAAFFDGTDMNDNVAAGDFMRRLRTLTTVLGNPAVVIPAHPIKGADQSKLSPYGGGAIINEVDGNLTLWRRGNACRLHWQTKFRGPDFAPVFFRFRGKAAENSGRAIVSDLGGGGSPAPQ